MPLSTSWSKLFVNMLSIRVSEWSVILVGFDMTGKKFAEKQDSRKSLLAV